MSTSGIPKQPKGMVEKKVSDSGDKKSGSQPENGKPNPRNRRKNKGRTEQPKTDTEKLSLSKPNKPKNQSNPKPTKKSNSNTNSSDDVPTGKSEKSVKPKPKNLAKVQPQASKNLLESSSDKSAIDKQSTTNSSTKTTTDSVKAPSVSEEAKLLKKKQKRLQQREKKKKLQKQAKEREQRLPVYKLTIRNLPPNLSKESFMLQVEQLHPEFKEFITEYYYVRGYYPVNQFEASIPSRCYINCSEETTMMQVGRAIKQMTFVDDKTTNISTDNDDNSKPQNETVETSESGEVVEEMEIYAPAVEKSFLQMMPDFNERGEIHIDKWDFFNNKLEESSAYKKFIKSIESNGEIPLPVDIFNKSKRVKKKVEKKVDSEKGKKKGDKKKSKKSPEEEAKAAEKKKRKKEKRKRNKLKKIAEKDTNGGSSQKVEPGKKKVTNDVPKDGAKPPKKKKAKEKKKLAD